MTAHSAGLATISVTLTVTHKTGPVWWVAEVPIPYPMTDEQVMDHVASELARYGVLRCTKVLTEAGLNRSRTVTGRIPVVLTTAGIATITPLHVELIEAA